MQAAAHSHGTADSSAPRPVAAPAASASASAASAPRAAGERFFDCSCRGKRKRNPAETGKRKDGSVANTRSAAPQVNVSDFVSENDVRMAITRQEKIFIGPKTIVTPSARDLASTNEVFVETHAFAQRSAEIPLGLAASEYSSHASSKQFASREMQR